MSGSFHRPGSGTTTEAARGVGQFVPQGIRLRHMPKADPRELKARAGGPKDSVWTQDSFPAVVAVASVGG